MTRTLSVRNRQRTRRVRTRLLRRIALWALAEQLGNAEFELGLHLVGAQEMAVVNQTFLNHEGSTDVITFDHREPAKPTGRVRRGQKASASHAANNASHGRLSGEIYICVDDAVAQARQFRTTWQSEVIRYLLHGLLHLHGHDDHAPAARRRMKREENRLLAQAAEAFAVNSLADK